MASLIIRNNVIYLTWYDPFQKKQKRKTTKLTNSKENYEAALKKAKEFQKKLDVKYETSIQKGYSIITIAAAFDHFKKINENKHSKTLADYERFYKKFSEIFTPEKPTSIINKGAVEDWLLSLRKLKLSQNSIHGYGKQCSHFLNFLFEYNYVPMFKINREVKTKPEIKPIIHITEMDLKIIFDNLGNKNEHLKLLIRLLFYTGLRSSDLLSINIDDIDLENRLITYYSPKRKIYRTIPFHDNLFQALSQRGDEVKTGKLLNYNSVENLGKAVTRFFKKINLSKKGYTARTFRKTFVTLCRNKFNMDATIVKELVGHEHTNTTDRYYNSISYEVMKRELQKFKYDY
ncbi:MAG: site-specific integrase [Melioribacteraceae bacterium]|nr:site-specific integrase [Melioribacteraceae bacterium]